MEWFAKRGIPWHMISHERVLTSENKKVIGTDVHCQVLKDYSPQDSTCAVALILSSLKAYKAANPEVKFAVVKADNAGQS